MDKPGSVNSTQTSFIHRWGLEIRDYGIDSSVLLRMNMSLVDFRKQNSNQLLFAFLLASLEREEDAKPPDNSLY